MDPVRAALGTELMEMVLRGGISIDGFGSLQARTYPAYEGRDPRTGQIVQVAAAHDVHFKTAPELRERIYNATTDSLPIACPELVARAVPRTGETPEVVARALAAWLSRLVDEIDVAPHGRPLGAVGILRIGTRPETPVRNPQTGEMIISPARRFVELEASRCAKVRFGDGMVGGYVDGDRVAAILERYPSVESVEVAGRMVRELDAAAGDRVLAEADTCAVLDRLAPLPRSEELDAVLASLPY